MRDEALKTRIKTDPHSPGMIGRFSLYLILMLFTKHCNIKEGDKMYISPEDRVRIW